LIEIEDRLSSKKAATNGGFLSFVWVFGSCVSTDFDQNM